MGGFGKSESEPEPQTQIQGGGGGDGGGGGSRGGRKKKKRCVFVCERRKGEAHRRAGLRRRRYERGKGEEGGNRGGQGRGKGGEYGGGEGRGEGVWGGGVKPHQSMKYRPQKNRQTKKEAVFSLTHTHTDTHQQDREGAPVAS